jgi:hypothetical protein
MVLRAEIPAQLSTLSPLSRARIHESAELW